MSAKAEAIKAEVKADTVDKIAAVANSAHELADNSAAKIEVVSEAVKTYVRDELGRFAKAEVSVKQDAVAVAEKIAGTQEPTGEGEPMRELTDQEQRDVAGGDLPRGGITGTDGPHGSW